MFSFEYPIFSTNCIKIKFTCNSCGTVIEDSICEIPKPNLDGGDTHSFLHLATSGKMIKSQPPVKRVVCS